MEPGGIKEFDDTSGCPICFEIFDHENYIPRLLPCSHTICVKCVTKVLGSRNFLICPQCRKKHAAYSGVNAFPCNKYILRHLQPKSRSFTFGACQQHGGELNMFCKGGDCKKDICRFCLLENHFGDGHDVVDIVQEENNKAKAKLYRVSEYITQCSNTLTETKDKIMSASKQSLMKLEEHKEQYIKMLNTKIDTVKNRLEYEEKEINRQLQVINDELMKLNDIKCKVDSGSKDKDIKRRSDMIDIIEKNTKNVFDKRCIFMYYKCKDVFNDKLLMRKASPKLISNFVTTESSTTALSSSRSSIPNTVSSVASQNKTTPKPTGVSSESSEVVVVGTTSPSLQHIGTREGVSTESPEVVIVGITSPTQPSAASPKRSRSCVPKVTAVGTPSLGPSMTAIKPSGVGKDLRTMAPISGAPCPGGNPELPKNIPVWTKSPTPNLATTTKAARMGSGSSRRATTGTPSPRPSPPTSAAAVRTSFRSGMATSKLLNNSHREWLLAPVDMVARGPSSSIPNASSSLQSRTVKNTSPKQSSTSPAVAAFERKSQTFGRTTPKSAEGMALLVAPSMTSTSTPSKIPFSSFASTSQKTAESNLIASTIPKTMTPRGVSPKSAPESSQGQRHTISESSPVSATLTTTQLVTTFSTCEITCIQVLADDSIIACESDSTDVRLTRYNIHGGIIQSIDLERTIDHIEVITADDKECIALADWVYQKIEFRDVQALDQVVHSYSSEDFEPTRLCAMSSTNLLYKEGFTLLRPVKWLDCQMFPPKLLDRCVSLKELPSGETSNFDGMHDMCLMENNNCVLLVVVTLDGSVAAFDVQTNEQKWEVSEVLPNHSSPLCAHRVATDGRNNLFVRDNKCVHLFSADGKYVRTVLSKGEHGLQSIKHVCWCPKSASLAIVHGKRKRKEYYISIIRNVI